MGITVSLPALMNGYDSMTVPQYMAVLFGVLSNTDRSIQLTCNAELVFYFDSVWPKYPESLGGMQPSALAHTIEQEC